MAASRGGQEVGQVGRDMLLKGRSEFREFGRIDIHHYSACVGSDVGMVKTDRGQVQTGAKHEE